MSELRPTPFQERVLSTPLDTDLFLGGGRGGGKSWAIAWLILQHCEAFGAAASVLYIRREHAGLRDFERILLQLFGAAYGGEANYNLKSGIWRLPNGATVELGQGVSVPQSFPKYQGRSFSMVCVDELGQFFDLALADALRSCLRGPAKVATRFVAAANPNGAGHALLLKRYVRKLKPWAIQGLEGVSDRIIHCPSTLDDNPTINKSAYEASLRNAVGNDAGRYRAWRLGDWEAGASELYFAAVWDEAANIVPVFDGWPVGCKPFVSLDWGTLRPAYCALLASPRSNFGLDGRFYPAKSIIAVDEACTCRSEDLNIGDGSTVEDFAAEIERLWSRHDLPGKPTGVADDAIWARLGGRGTPSVADQFRAAGVNLIRANKGQRRQGWEQMRSMMQAAHDGSGRPGFFVSAACAYGLSTVPFLPRDPRKFDDVATGAADHAGDAWRYGLSGARPLTQARRIRTTYDAGRSSLDLLDAQIRGEVRV
jgi:hypothetical protein